MVDRISWDSDNKFALQNAQEIVGIIQPKHLNRMLERLRVTNQENKILSIIV